MLLREVISAGWDQVDVNNYVLYYNGQVETRLAVPVPSLDISMKQTINTLIRTKLRDQEEQEEEITLVTPLNPKGTSTGKLPEPNLGILPPGPRRRKGESSKSGPALSMKMAQAEARKAMAAKKGRAAKSGGKKTGVKAGVKAGVKGGFVKKHRFCPGTVALKEIRRYQKSTELLIWKLPFQ